MLVPEAVLVIGYVAALYMAWNIGANDASNPTETAVGSGALSVKQAIILFSIFAGLGAVLQGFMVMKTIGKGVSPLIDLAGPLAAVIGAGLWITIATYKGMPISTSQSIVGGVLGVGISYVFLGLIEVDDIRFDVLAKVIASWITSPILSILLAMLLYKVFVRLTQVFSLQVFRWLLIGSLLFSAYSFGANDVGNATGVYFVVTSRYLGLPDLQTRLFLAILGSIGIALGAFTMGRRVIETVAYRITRLDYVTGVAAEYSNALVVWFFTTIPYMLFGFGMPISTTHASVSAVIGAGLAKTRGLRGINLRTVFFIVLSWILTLPVSAFFALIAHQILYRLIPPI